MSAFYIHGSVHRNSLLIRSNKIQHYAGIYLLQNYSTCFGYHRIHHQKYIGTPVDGYDDTRNM